jgi:TonB family protein
MSIPRLGSKRSQAVVLLFCLCSVCSKPYLSAQTDLESTIRARYDQRIIMLRNFYQDDHLEFDSAGSVKGKAHPGAWTLGRVGITKIKLQPNRLELDGVRVADVYNVKASKFNSVRTPQKVRIVVDRDPQQTSSLEDALSRIFLTNAEKLADVVPPYWKAIAERRVEAVPQTQGPTCYRIKGAALMTASGEIWMDCEEHATVKQVSKPESQGGPPHPPFRVGGGVTAPKLVYGPDPHYVPLAKEASFQGTTLLIATVTEQGTIDEVQIVRPVGFGFDDTAVETVKTWTFKPAMKEGKPVAVQIHIEVNFRLY